MAGKYTLARRLSIGLFAALSAGAVVLTINVNAHAETGLGSSSSGSGASVALVTKTLAGKPSGLGLSSSLSGDGRYVAFRANPGGALAKGVKPGCMQVYWRDMKKGITRVASAAADGSMDNTSCLYLDQAISGDGRYVAFTRPDATFKPVAHTGDGWRNYFLFVKDMQTGKLTSYALPALPRVAGHSPWTITMDDYFMSGDGQQVVVNRLYNDLGWESTYVLDRKTRGWTTVCQIAVRCQPRSMSADGRYVSLLYQPLLNNKIVPYVAGLWDRTTGKIRTFPTPSTDDSFGPDRQVVSPNGKLFFASFVSWYPEEHYRTDIYDPGSGKRIQTIANRTDVSSVSSVSWDGRYILSPAIEKSVSRFGQAYQFDRLTMRIRNASVSPTGKPADFGVWPYGMSYDGSRILFATQAGNLVAGDRKPTGENDQVAWDDFVGTLH